MAPLNQQVGQDFQDALNAPALQPPSGVTADFTNPPNENVYAYLALTISIVLVSIVVILRVYARLIRFKVIHTADYIGLMAFGSWLALVYYLFAMLSDIGFFVHQWNLHVKDLIVFNWLWFISFHLYCVTIATIKSAIVVEWMFIFVPAHTRNAFYWISQTLLWLNIVFYIAILVFINLACHPHSKLWDPLLPGTCINTSFSAPLIGSFNLATDVILFILPQKVIWSLRMSLKQRLGVSLIFLVGILAIISASFKLAGAIPYDSSNDTTYTFAALVLWSFAESTCGIIIFCLPSIPKALHSLGLIDTIALSVKSWAELSRNILRKTRLASPTGSSWRSVTSKPSDLNMREQANNTYELPDISPIIAESDDKRSQYEGGTVIVRTRQFTARESREIGSSGDDDLKGHLRQHPWISDR
ncbi:hypothetical protein F5Y16DRAFT_380327 [Xylariaceae sp. FL0255]|nr:hypothetical protein F5Y16DRAFT_380327 [Xylariaceae sp. FL0255]